MASDYGIRRVIIVILDGLRPDAIDAFNLTGIRECVDAGASSLTAQTVTPSVTAAALTSLMTGVSPGRHGITGEGLFIPRAASTLDPLPQLLADSGYPSAAFLGEIPAVFKGIGARVGRRLGFGTTRFSGRNAAEILAAARSTLRAQRRGLVLLHWPDADRSGHDVAWMSADYAHACRKLNDAMGSLCSLLDLAADRSTLLVLLSDHGGGGADPRDHESHHPLDLTIPIAFVGAAVVPGVLENARLIDVPSTALHALGVSVPPTYEGRVHSMIFEAAPREAAREVLCVP